MLAVRQAGCGVSDYDPFQPANDPDATYWARIASGVFLAAGNYYAHVKDDNTVSDVQDARARMAAEITQLDDPAEALNLLEKLDVAFREWWTGQDDE